ncbi:beta/alpha barrel domain-containing protein [Desulfovibrio falkowii]|uniref:Pyruvate carboxyltransferase domain-containing protein n=1 Tax=Desulfovibrio falkowii TaxID=3136602 RepID=A0ABQ0E7M6_9BACT
MGCVRLLDCTLRDGGYVNDWNFGKKNIASILELLKESRVDIIEVGFLRDEPFNEDRTIYNSIAQFKEVVGTKAPHALYSAMVEVQNPYPIEMLDEHDGEGPDFIRVVIWKRLLDEGLEYCKQVIAKGYPVCVQPARVDQYSDEEFADIVRKFSEIKPMAIYVVDSWGCLDTARLLHYMRLCDQNMDASIALGYHGHNAMMQTFGVAQAMLAEGFERDIFLDASVNGIGRGSGNLHSEIIAEHLNTEAGKNYNLPSLLEIFDKYVLLIFLELLPKGLAWGYSHSYLLAAKYGCNPGYAEYYAAELKLSPVDIEEIFKTFGKEKIIFNRDYADKQLRQWRHNTMRFAIIVPTANKPYAIGTFLQQAALACQKYGIDIIVYDSSKDDRTKNIVLNYQQDKESSNVLYHRYTGAFDGVSIDTKVMDAYRDYADDYDYIWAIRDGLIPVPDGFYPLIEQHVRKKIDFIAVDASFRSNNALINKEYTDRADFFKENGRRFNMLGSVIIRSEAAKAMLAEIPLDDTNYSFWLPSAVLTYFARHEATAVTLVDNVYIYNPNGTTKSFWNKSETMLKVWVLWWPGMIDNLPGVYNKHKNFVKEIRMFDFIPFRLSFLMQAKANNSLPLKWVWKFRKKIPDVSTSTPFWKVLLIALLPPPVASIIVRHWYSYPIRFVRCFLKNEG